MADILERLIWGPHGGKSLVCMHLGFIHLRISVHESKYTFKKIHSCTHAGIYLPYCTHVDMFKNLDGVLEFHPKSACSVACVCVCVWVGGCVGVYVGVFAYVHALRVCMGC